MNDNPYAATATVHSALPVAGAAPFHVVSRRKLIVLYIATLGLYGTYWFYRQWACWRDSGRGVGVWPVARALFAPLFVHALLRNVKTAGSGNPAVDAWRHGLDAGRMTLLMCVSWALVFTSDKYTAMLGTYGVDLVQLAITACVLMLTMRIQAMINLACADPDGRTNSTFTVANHAWIALGVVLWVLGLVGMFLPE